MRITAGFHAAVMLVSNPAPPHLNSELFGTGLCKTFDLSPVAKAIF
jgi:hypothetical protein